MNKIIFSPIEHVSELVVEHVEGPQKGTSIVSEWFKNVPRYQNNENNLKVDGSYHNLTVRHCMPFLDSMTNGYFLTTWTDIYIRRENGYPIISYKDLDIVNKFGYGLIQYQEHFQSYIPQMPGFDPFSYAWSVYWRIKTPPGTSCLFINPLNRTDLPFFTLSGTMDTDGWNGSDVLNFALKKDFEGIIPKGTPYVQIIPFYRNNWDHEITEQPDLKFKETRDKVIDLRHNKLKSGYYRDNIWHTKKYL